MNWPEISIEDFPPRRDDEPSSLRQDIIDELSDHFACALNRELLKNSDEQLAKQRVLSQFGDPIIIARQLWLDAMKEKIMSQRIMTGISAVMAVCCIAVVGFAWSMMKQSERVNLLVLERLTQNPPVQESIGTEDMNQISFQLIQQGASEKPATGFSGTLTKEGDKAESFLLDAVADDSGKLQFGSLPWGKYSLKLHAPWGETAILKSFVTIPGRDYLQTIDCPVRAPDEIPVKFQIHWPEGLNSDEWVALCDFRYPQKGKEPVPYVLKSQRSIQNQIWTFEQNLKEAPAGVYLVDGENRVTPCPLMSQGNYQNTSDEALNFLTEVPVKQGSYHLSFVYLIRKADLKKIAELSAHPDLGIIAYWPNNNPSMRVQSKPRYMTGYISYVNFSESLILSAGLSRIFNSPVNSDNVTKIHGVQIPDTFTLNAAKEQTNLWEINLPPMDLSSSYFRDVASNL